jgi:hypothetical protein
VVAIALVAVGRVTSQLAVEPPQARYDEDQAVEFVAEALPGDVTARLSYDDVRRLLRWNVEFLASNDLTDGLRYAEGEGLIVVADEETVAYLRDRAATSGWHTVSPDDIRAVADAQMTYLSSIGAVGEQVPDPTSLDDEENPESPPE